MRVVDKPRAVIVAAAVLFGGIYFAEVHQEHASASCRSQYARAFAESITARSGTAGARQDTADALLGGVADLVLHPPKTEADRAAAGARYTALFSAYLKASDAAKATKDDNPYPTFPNC